MPSITRPRTPPSKRRAESETAILAAVERLLMNGASFTELSVQRLADEAGVARSTFYLCFQDKTEVLVRLTSSMKDELFAMGEGWRPVGPDGGLEGLIEVFTRQLKYYRERAPLLAAINEVIAYDDSLRHETLTSLSRFTKRTIAQLREERRAGRLSPGVDPVTSGQVLTWGGEQAVARQVEIGDRKDDAKVAKALAELQWFGVYRRP